jgi:hypothetical protein
MSAQSFGRHARRLAGLALVASLCLASGCPSPRPATAVVVQVFATPSVLAHAPSSLAFDVAGGPTDDALGATTHESAAVGTWPVLLTLVPREGGERAFRVDVAALDRGGATLVTAHLRSRFVSGQTRTYALWLDDSCAPPCGADQSCAGGGCRSAIVEPSELAPFDGRLDAGRGPVLDAALDAWSPDAPGLDAPLPPPVDAPAPPCMPTDVPTSEVAVFVSHGAVDDVATGEPNDPFRTLGAAVAARGTHDVVVVEEGTYDEALVIEGSGTLRVVGGFTRAGATWSRDCTAGAAENTIVRSPQATAIEARLTGTLTLEALAIEAHDGAAGLADTVGESSIGVIVSSTVERLSIVDATVRAGRGGAGGAGARGSSGVGCAPMAACSAMPLAGEPGGPGAPGARGSFGPSGFMPSVAERGDPGGGGSYGTAAPAPPSSPSCVDGCAGDGMPYCAPASTSTHTGGAGSCGCGGVGGAGGAGGAGGGASIALLLTGATTLDLARATILSADGGAGGAGGEGGDPDGGSAGRRGAVVACASGCTTCVPTPGCSCTASGITNLAGEAGGHGAAGGAGGHGGGGAGGPSFAIVLASGASVAGLETSLVDHGAGGTGAGTAPSGAAGPVGP